MSIVMKIIDGSEKLISSCILLLTWCLFLVSGNIVSKRQASLSPRSSGLYLRLGLYTSDPDLLASIRDPACITRNLS